MKQLWVVNVFFIIFCTNTINAQCVQGLLKFGNTTCLENNSNTFPLNDLFNGKKCQEIACTGYVNVIKSYICIWPRKLDIKMMFYGSERNSTHDIPLNINKDDTFTVKQISVSEKHISLLIISGDCAYRMAFFMNQLGHVNKFKMVYLGSADSVVWQPFYDVDVYMQIINGEIINTTKRPHSEGRNISLYTISEQCPKWNDTQTNSPNSNSQNMPSTSTQSTRSSGIKDETIIAIVSIIAVSVIILTAVYTNSIQAIPPSSPPPPTATAVEPPPPPQPLQAAPSYHTTDPARNERPEDAQQTQNVVTESRASEDTTPLNTQQTQNTVTESREAETTPLMTELAL